jgi:hypothetical protein
MTKERSINLVNHWWVSNFGIVDRADIAADLPALHIHVADKSRAVDEIEGFELTQFSFH